MRWLQVGALAVIASALLAAPAQAQADGELWRDMGDDVMGRTAKISYLNGATDGVGLGGDTAVGRSMPEFSLSLVEGVDEFYAEPANRRLPIVWALQILNLKLKGKSEEDINRETRYRRCSWAAVRGLQHQPVDSLRRLVQACANER